MKTKIYIPGGTSSAHAKTAIAVLALLTLIPLVISAGIRPAATGATEAEGV